MPQKKTLSILTFLIASSCQAQQLDFNYGRDFSAIVTESQDASSDKYYPNLLGKFKAGDTSMSDLQILHMMIGATTSDYFAPYSSIFVERDIQSMLNSGDYEQTLAMSNAFLKFVPVNQSVILIKSQAHKKLGETDSASLYYWQYERIMQMMEKSGEGSSPETAIFSYGPADGQNFIRKYLGRTIGTMGSGRDSEGHFLDILEMVWKDESGVKKTLTLYFNIAHATSTMFTKNVDFADLVEKEMKNNKKKKK